MSCWRSSIYRFLEVESSASTSITSGIDAADKTVDFLKNWHLAPGWLTGLSGLELPWLLWLRWMLFPPLVFPLLSFLAFISTIPATGYWLLASLPGSGRDFRTGWGKSVQSVACCLSIISRHCHIGPEIWYRMMLFRYEIDRDCCTGLNSRYKVVEISISSRDCCTGLENPYRMLSRCLFETVIPACLDNWYGVASLELIRCATVGCSKLDICKGYILFDQFSLVWLLISCLVSKNLVSFRRAQKEVPLSRVY